MAGERQEGVIDSSPFYLPFTLTLSFPEVGGIDSEVTRTYKCIQGPQNEEAV